MMAIRHLAPCCWIMGVLMASAALAPSTAFVLSEATRPHNNHPCCCCPQISLSSSVLLFMHHTEDFDHEIVGDDAGGVVIEDLAWRVEQLRLEEQNKQRFLKAKARFLPYEECMYTKSSCMMNKKGFHEQILLDPFSFIEECGRILWLEYMLA